MPFQVRLYSDSNLKDNVKYRAGGLNNSTLIGTVQTVMNGSLANGNIYGDNSVEISLPLITCALASHITVTFGGTTVIAGEVVSCVYINDSNTSISYTVDPFTTAQMTNSVRAGFFTSCFGCCARTNLTYPSESTANQQSEPYSGGDIRTVDLEVSELINNPIRSQTGIGTNDGGALLEEGYGFVLWISGWAAACLNGAGWAINKWGSYSGAGVHPKITLVTEFGENGVPGDANTEWHGSWVSGFPIFFQDEKGLGDFINGMLDNVGERMIISPDGIDNDGVIRRLINVDNQYIYAPQNFTESQQEQMVDVDMEQVRIITNQDIFRIQVVPEFFCHDRSDTQTFEETITLPYNLATFNPMRDERTTILPDGTVVNDYSKSKLMMYPYYYHKMVLANGNEINIIPQIHWVRNNYLINTYQLIFNHRFMGGEMPKLQISVNQNAGDHTHDWHTIIEYPSISWSTLANSQQQLGELSARMNRKSQITAGLIGASLKGTGFMFGFRGGRTGYSEGNTLSGGRGFMAGLGQAAGGLVGGLSAVDEALTGRSINNRSPAAHISKEQAELDSTTAMDNAGRVVTGGGEPIIGNGGFECLTAPPVMFYRCGMSDGELWGFARMIERKGQSIYCNINPLTNAGEILGGNGSITSYGGKTYYEFMDLDVVGTMPIQYKNAIQTMFCGGCYLIG